MTSRPNPPKKVRLACRRCRARRIKCDGHVPACTNCAKAGQVCLDVDSQNSSLIVPRNFAGAARARIQWLEDIIRDRLPDVDLKLAPPVDGLADTSSREQDTEDGIAVAAMASPCGSDLASDRRLSHARQLKRPADRSSTADHRESVPEQAHSVAVNLGMLSLNSDSPQKHYLGSSSGVLFTQLIGASPSSTASPMTASIGDASGDWDEHIIAKPAPQYASLYAVLEQELPRKSDALLLIRTYIRSLHPDYPVLEPSSILGALEALYACLSASPDNDHPAHGWPLSAPVFTWNGIPINPRDPDAEIVPMPVIAFIMFMIFNAAAIIKVRSRVYDHPPDKFYAAATQFSNACFSRITLSSIQGLVMLIVHSMLTPADINLWTLVHVALAHCVELGIHRRGHPIDPRNPTHEQVRRFVFFTVYSLDRSISSIQGRPLGFRDETFDVELPEPFKLDLGPANNDAGYHAFTESVTGYATYQFKLDRIVSDIKLHLYHLPVASAQFPWPEDPDLHQSRIKSALESWWQDFSRDVAHFTGIDNQQRQIWKTKMSIRYHTTIVLLFQPSQVVRHPATDSLRICFDSASSILGSYQFLHDCRHLQHGWRSVQNIFAAGATLIYSFWTSQAVRRSASATHLSQSLRTCSNLLTIGGEWWPSAKSGQISFGLVADQTLGKLYADNASNKHPRLSVQQASRLATYQDEGDLEDADRSEPVPGLDLFGAAIETTSLPSAEPGTSWCRLPVEALPSTVDDQDSWQAIHPPVASHDDMADFAPEVETFLADFDRSDFNWSFPLNGPATDLGLSGFPGPGF